MIFLLPPGIKGLKLFAYDKNLSSVSFILGRETKPPFSSLLTQLNASVTVIETSQLICFANLLTGFYMRATLAFNGLS